MYKHPSRKRRHGGLDRIYRPALRSAKRTRVATRSFNTRGMRPLRPSRVARKAGRPGGSETRTFTLYETYPINEVGWNASMTTPSKLPNTLSSFVNWYRKLSNFQGFSKTLFDFDEIRVDSMTCSAKVSSNFFDQPDPTDPTGPTINPPISNWPYTPSPNNKAYCNLSGLNQYVETHACIDYSGADDSGSVDKYTWADYVNNPSSSRGHVTGQSFGKVAQWRPRPAPIGFAGTVGAAIPTWNPQTTWFPKSTFLVAGTDTPHPDQGGNNVEPKFTGMNAAFISFDAAATGFNSSNKKNPTLAVVVRWELKVSLRSPVNRLNFGETPAP